MIFYHIYFYIQYNCYSKNHFPCLFIIICFFMLRIISNVCKYSVFNKFVLFFNLKRFLTHFIVAQFVSFFSFFNQKRFLSSLLLFSLTFLFSLSLELLKVMCCKKHVVRHFLQKKLKVHYSS